MPDRWIARKLTIQLVHQDGGDPLVRSRWTFVRFCSVRGSSSSTSTTIVSPHLDFPLLLFNGRTQDGNDFTCVASSTRTVSRSPVRLRHFQHTAWCIERNRIVLRLQPFATLFLHPPTIAIFDALFFFLFFLPLSLFFSTLSRWNRWYFCIESNVHGWMDKL